MMPGLKRLARRGLHTGLLAVFALSGLLGAGGCADDSKQQLSPAQAAFKTYIQGLYQREAQVFIPLLKQPNPGPKLQANIDRQFSEAIQAGKPLEHDLAVLSPQATVLAWRGPNPDDLKDTYQGFIGQNYSKFTKLNPVFQDHHMASFEVYTQYGPGLGLCAPLREGGHLLGVFCLGYDEDVLKKYRHLNKTELLAIDFNQ